MTDTRAIVKELTEERLDLIAAKEKIEQQVKDIDEALLRHLPELGGRFELLPGQGVRIAPPKKNFSKEKALKFLTPTQYAAICVPTPTSAQARAILPGAVVEQLFEANGNHTVQALRGGGDRR